MYDTYVIMRCIYVHMCIYVYIHTYTDAANTNYEIYNCLEQEMKRV